MKRNSDDVLLTYRTPASRINEMLMQADILTEHGLQVIIAETGYGGRPEQGVYLLDVQH